MNLRENIDRIKQMMGLNKKLISIIPNRFVYHTSNPIFRQQIKEVGLIPKGKSESWLSDTPTEGKVIFATNSDSKEDWFDSTYDDDIYKIDTSTLNNQWYLDPNFGTENNQHIITFEPIPLDVIKLIYKGSIIPPLSLPPHNTNLNENIFFRRRINTEVLDSIFNEQLSYWISHVKKDMSRRNIEKLPPPGFAIMIHAVISWIMDEIHPELISGREDFPYDEIFQFLTNRYFNQMEQAYIDNFGGLQ